eukprot:SAG11_NODE_21_length_25065_cov_3.589081_28_plen_96_part_00
MYGATTVGALSILTCSKVKPMSEAGTSVKYLWTANGWSNIVTISAAALSSVLLVVFKSRCSKITLCWGLWSCDRVVQEESDGEGEQRPDPAQNEP